MKCCCGDPFFSSISTKYGVFTDSESHHNVMLILWLICEVQSDLLFPTVKHMDTQVKKQRQKFGLLSHLLSCWVTLRATVSSISLYSVHWGLCLFHDYYQVSTLQRLFVIKWFIKDNSLLGWKLIASKLKKWHYVYMIINFFNCIHYFFHFYLFLASPSLPLNERQIQGKELRNKESRELVCG